MIELLVDFYVILKSFSTFYANGVIMYFTSKIPSISWVKQWVRGIMVIGLTLGWTNSIANFKGLRVGWSGN